MRKWGFLTIIALLSFVMATEIKFTALEINYNNTKVGEVLYKNQTIMRLLVKGEFLTPFARAQIIAFRLNENIKTINDVKNIIYKYPNDIYTAYLNNNNLFSIYEEEVKYNGSTPEGLMGSWINNLKRVMIVDGIPESNIKESKKKEIIESKDILIQEIVASPEEKSTGVDIVEINDLKEQIKELEKKIAKPLTPSNNLIVFIVIGINILFSLILILLYLKVRKRLGIYSQLEKTENLEELENTVSVLIKELQGTSETVTEKAQNTIKELDAKIAGASSISVPEKKEQEAKPIETKSVPQPVPVEKKPIMPEPEVPEIEMTEIVEPEKSSELSDILNADLEREVKEVKAEVRKSEDNKKTIPEEKSIAEQLAEEIDKQIEGGAEKESDQIDLGEEDEFEVELRKEMDAIITNEAMTQNEKVVQLASMNVMQEEIAKELNMGVGEVELILQLNK